MSSGLLRELRRTEALLDCMQQNIGAGLYGEEDITTGACLIKSKGVNLVLVCQLVWAKDRLLQHVERST